MLRDRIEERNAVQNITRLNIAMNPHVEEPQHLYDIFQNKLERTQETPKQQDKLDREGLMRLKEMMSKKAR